VDPANAKPLFQKLCRVTKGLNSTLEEGVAMIERALKAGRIDLDRLVGEATLSETPYTDETSSSLHLNRDILVFLARASVQPFLEEMAHHLAGQFDQSNWNKGICPICGSSPILSELSGDEGRRMWICSLCSHRWEGARMACPFCGQEDSEGHRYLFVEADETLRIDVCDRCNRYIKTIDTRNAGQAVFPMLEHIGSIHLDILAQGEGYQRGSAPFLDIG
jgi:FdhE protein